MGQFAAIAALIGMGMQAKGQYEAGQQEKEAFNQRADVLNEDALATEKAAREQSRDTLLQGKRLAGKQKVQVAGSGVNLAGTPLLVLAETRREIARDAGYMIEEGYTSASRMRQQAVFEKKMGKSAGQAGMWQAGGSLLTGGASFAQAGDESKWWAKKKSKPFTPKSYAGKTTY